MRQKTQIILFTTVVFIALFTLVFLKIPNETFLWRSVFNVGHVPLFGVISLAVLQLSFRLFSKRFLNPYRHYLLALCVSVFLGLLTEITQLFGSRDADFWDLMCDAAGIVSFLVLYLTFDSRINAFKSNIKAKLKYTFRVTAVLLILSTFTPTAIWTAAYFSRNKGFPVLCSFESKWEKKFIKTKDAIVTIISSPEDWDAPSGTHVGQLTFLKETYPSFVIEEPYPDWSEYKAFTFYIYSEITQTIELELRIHDIHHNHSYDDRFNQTVVVNPGLNKVLISLDDVRAAPKSRTMDMKNIHQIILFTVKPPKIFTLYLDDFRLVNSIVKDPTSTLIFVEMEV